MAVGCFWGSATGGGGDADAVSATVWPASADGGAGEGGAGDGGAASRATPALLGAAPGLRTHPPKKIELASMRQLRLASSARQRNCIIRWAPIAAFS